MASRRGTLLLWTMIFLAVPCLSGIRAQTSDEVTVPQQQELSSPNINQVELTADSARTLYRPFLEMQKRGQRRRSSDPRRSSERGAARHLRQKSRGCETAWFQGSRTDQDVRQRRAWRPSCARSGCRLSGHRSPTSKGRAVPQAWTRPSRAPDGRPTISPSPGALGDRLGERSTAFLPRWTIQAGWVSRFRHMAPRDASSARIRHEEALIRTLRLWGIECRCDDQAPVGSDQAWQWLRRSHFARAASPEEVGTGGSPVSTSRPRRRSSSKKAATPAT